MIDDPCLLLIGPRGSGKSSLARLTARACGRRLINTDAEIERRAGRSIAELVAAAGWDEFRRIESRVISELDRETGAVLDLGGGAVLDPRNRRTLAGIGRWVLLLAPPAELARRTAAQGGIGLRPALSAATDPAAEAAAMLAQRLALYRELAELELDTNQLDPQAAAQRIIEFMGWRIV